MISQTLIVIVTSALIQHNFNVRKERSFANITKPVRYITCISCKE